MVAGVLAIRWRHFAAVTIAHAVESATHLRMPLDPLQLPGRCHLFRRIVAAVMVVATVVAGGVNLFAKRAQPV